MKRIIPFLLLALVLAACHEDNSTVLLSGPQFAKDGPGKPDKPPKPDNPAERQITLCAKQAVVDEINGIQEPWPDDYAGWNGPEIGSSGPSCGVDESTQAGEYGPSGTFTYMSEGPELEWKFRGEGFVPPIRGWAYGYHHYVLIYYPDPWPGRDLVCLGDGKASGSGRLTLQGSHDFGGTITDGKVWIVRKNWVDCTGTDEKDPYWANPEGVPRLTNDRNDNGDADATETRLWCYPPTCGYDEGDLAYDWLFEATGQDLVNYTDTGG
jgi:hypothetical protein